MSAADAVIDELLASIDTDTDDCPGISPHPRPSRQSRQVLPCIKPDGPWTWRDVAWTCECLVSTYTLIDCAGLRRIMRERKTPEGNVLVVVTRAAWRVPRAAQVWQALLAGAVTLDPQERGIDGTDIQRAREQRHPWWARIV